jgi:hypothetical protein
LMDPLEERILDREICQLADEAVKNDIRCFEDPETPRSLMARAQVVMVKAILDYLMKYEDWSDFEDETWDNLEMQKTMYRDAREADDREKSRIYLARVRLLTRLLNRLNDFKRSRLIGLSFPPLPPGESSPPLALRLLKEELVQRGEWDEERGMVSPESPADSAPADSGEAE